MCTAYLDIFQIHPNPKVCFLGLSSSDYFRTPKKMSEWHCSCIFQIPCFCFSHIFVDHLVLLLTILSTFRAFCDVLPVVGTRKWGPKVPLSPRVRESDWLGNLGGFVLEDRPNFSIVRIVGSTLRVSLGATRNSDLGKHHFWGANC